MSFENPIRLPHTDLMVGRIGLGSSFGVSAEDLEIAFDHGINTFYWGSIRRPGFGAGVRRLARSHRDKMVVALQSYARWPAALMRFRFEAGLKKLGLDHADILVLGWYNTRPPQWILDEAMELREEGKVRFLMMSGHNRKFFPVMAEESLIDLFMVRYNAAHRGAEQDVFPHLPEAEEHPGIVAYTATRWATLIDKSKTPAELKTPLASDCYRFCLSNPDVDMVWCGPARTEHVHTACNALKEGPLDDDEMEWIKQVGDHVYGRSPVKNLAD